jgi:hypothetical protein
MKVVGGIWALLGAINIIGNPNWLTPSPALSLVFALILNMVLFIIPGLVLCGIGVAITKKKNDLFPQPLRGDLTFCTCCGHSLVEGHKFCGSCGASQ